MRPYVKRMTANRISQDSLRMWLSGEIILDSEAFLTHSEAHFKLALKIHFVGLKNLPLGKVGLAGNLEWEEKEMSK